MDYTSKNSYLYLDGTNGCPIAFQLPGRGKHQSFATYGSAGCRLVMRGDGGFLKNRQGQWLYDNNGLLMPCPHCHEKRITGAGSFVEVPVPIEGQPDLHDPVGMLSVDRASLDYTTEEDARLREAIITAIVGTNEEITTRDALNEQQIKANFESQSTVLNRVKKGFEEAQAFVDETCCRLRYGTAFISLNINYGTEFYLQTSDELRERYKNAKESGASEADLDALSQQIIETEYRTNPQMMQRMIILSDLEPYRHLSREEVQTLRDKNLVSDVTVMVKMNFADYIRRFERENMNVTEFGEYLVRTASWAAGLSSLYATGKADKSYSAAMAEFLLADQTFKDEWKRLEREFLDWTFNQWSKRAQERGEIPQDFELPEDWRRTCIQWARAELKALNPVDEQTATAQGLKNLTKNYHELLGPDWRRKLTETAEELNFIKGLGIPDPRLQTAAGALIPTNENGDQDK
jgi:hypothetical protein